MVFSSIPPNFLDHHNWHHQLQQQPGHQQGSGGGGGNSQLPPPPPPPPGGEGSIRPGSMVDRARLAKLPLPEPGLNCPRCDSTNTKFCYFNNYNLTQPRHFCKTCRRYWTRGRVEKESNGKAGLVSKFMDEMMPTKLFGHSPKYLSDFWVFWSHNHTSMNWDIQNRIKDAFCNSFYYSDDFRDVLVQFWGVEEEIEGELHLTTAFQPFALSNPSIKNEKLKKYRKHCVGYKLLVADEASGIVGRVFRNQLPEFGPQPEYYSVNEYPQRDFAIRCGIKSIMALPVFQHPGLACVGVLELLYPATVYFLYHVESVNRVLKEQRLSTIDMRHFSSQINQTYESHIQDEIQTAVKQVYWIHRLALGVIWVSFQGELVVPSLQMSFVNEELLTFVDHWSWSGPLRVDQGLVGKTFSSRDLYYCRDVSQLSISEYPQILFARKLGHATCFTACLRNISTGNHELVIEFSLSREMTYNRDLHSLFYSILTTMKQQLRSFEVVTGDKYIEIVNETHKEREQSSKELTSFKTISSPTTSEGDSLQSLGTTECSMMSTCKKPVSLSLTLVNESDQFIPESSFRVNTSEQRAESESSGWGNSETASTKWVNQFGYTMYADQPDIPILNRSRAESLSPGTPLSEASAIYADVEMTTHGELMAIKVSYKNDIIKFDLPHSSSYADLMESILNRWSFLKDKSFVIKYLNDFFEPVLLATDMELKECMVRTRSKGIKLIRMLIELEG